jgi:uncharacterized protein (DUF302 family)
MAAFERASLGLFVWWSANHALDGKATASLSSDCLGVAPTAERIELGARARGMSVLVRTDHRELAARDGYRLPPAQSLLIDRGTAGMPVKVVVWETLGGATMVALDGQPIAEHGSIDTQLQAVLDALERATQELAFD